MKVKFFSAEREIIYIVSARLSINLDNEITRVRYRKAAFTQKERAEARKEKNPGSSQHRSCLLLKKFYSTEAVYFSEGRYG